MDGCEAFNANVVAGQGSDDAQSIRRQGLWWIVVVSHDDEGGYRGAAGRAGGRISVCNSYVTRTKEGFVTNIIIICQFRIFFVENWSDPKTLFMSFLHLNLAKLVTNTLKSR